MMLFILWQMCGNSSFMNAGAVELQKELSKETDLELPSTFVFDYPSIAEMQGYLIVNMPMPVTPVAVPMTGQVATSLPHGQHENSSAEKTFKIPAQANEPVWLRMSKSERLTHIQQLVRLDDFEALFPPSSGLCFLRLPQNCTLYLNCCCRALYYPSLCSFRVL